MDLPTYKDPVYEALVTIALEELLREHPELTVCRWRGRPSIAYKRNVVSQDDLGSRLQADQFFADAENPVVDIPLDPNDVGDPKTAPNDEEGS